MMSVEWKHLDVLQGCDTSIKTAMHLAAAPAEWAVLERGHEQERHVTNFRSDCWLWSAESSALSLPVATVR